MRTIICVVTFVILLLIGFLGTPGLYKIVNREYLLALREYSRPIAKLTQDASDIEPEIANLRSKISIIAKGLRDLGDTLVAKQAAMKIANATPSEIAEVGIDFGKQSNALGSEGARLAGELKMLEERKANIEASRAELKKKLDASAADSVNIYLVARALALGAIGALMSIFAKYLSNPKPQPLFDDKASVGRMWASIAMAESYRLS